MYCPVCGSETTPGLNYCKRCGAGLGPTNPGDAGRSASRPFAMLWPVALVSLVGLIGLFATLVNLGERGFEARALVAVSAFAGATVLGVVALLIWLLMQLSGIRQGVSLGDRGRISSGGSTQPQLQAPPASVPSVTENTTRNFDPARLRDRSTSE